MAILPEIERLSYAQRIRQPVKDTPLIVARTETVLEILVLMDFSVWSALSETTRLLCGGELFM